VDLFILGALNGLQLGMLVFLLAAGFTLIFGLMNILNLAHGAFYTLGAYVGYLTMTLTGSFWLALMVGPAALFVFGTLLQLCVLQPLSEKGRSSHLDLALLTFGLLYATAGTVDVVFGSSLQTIKLPPVLDGSMSLFGVMTYPKYRVFIIGLGLLCALSIWAVLRKTLIGATIRAGVDDREMIISMGVNIRWTFAMVFGAGAALAGLAGVVAAPVLGIYAHMGITIIVITFVVVVIGGLGNVEGSFYSALTVGMVDSLVQTYIPQIDLFAVYILLIAIMIVKPAGLFAKQVRAA
jgi:branched-chain amino acid transport system permease protein